MHLGGVHLGNIENIQSCYDVKIANNIAHVNHLNRTILIFIIIISHKSTSVRLLPHYNGNTTDGLRATVHLQNKERASNQ